LVFHSSTLVAVNILHGLILRNPTKYLPEKFHSLTLHSVTIFLCDYAVRAVGTIPD